jgi:hypothetical protein
MISSHCGCRTQETHDLWVQEASTINSAADPKLCRPHPGKPWPNGNAKDNDVRCIGTVRVFRHDFALEDAIGSKSIPLECQLPLTVATINTVATLKVAPCSQTHFKVRMVETGTVRVFHHGFCCVRDRGIGLRLLYGARFLTEVSTRGCYWFPRLLAPSFCMRVTNGILLGRPLSLPLPP